MIQEYIKKLTAGNDLTVEEAAIGMDEVLDGGATPAQISAFLTALRMKGETIEEITGCAQTLKQKACHIRPKSGGYIDCVGTGGDGANTFNISTTAAFVIAAAGIPIAKHGNRAVSSKSGSADLLEELGVNIMIEPEQVQKCVEDIGIGFMFARTFNKSMKSVNGIRSDLGIRTIFNILGPISNPSDAKCQVIGVFDKNLTHPLAAAMMNMGVTSGMVMNGVSNGMDEFSTIGETAVSEIKDGTVIDYMVTPEQFGMKRAQEQDILGGNIKENAQITQRILQGEKGAKRDIVVLNAAAAIYASGKTATVQEGIALAEQLLDDGSALKKLEQLIFMTNQVR